MDVLTGQPSTRQTVDADELLYWIVDDAAKDAENVVSQL